MRFHPEPERPYPQSFRPDTACADRPRRGFFIRFGIISVNTCIQGACRRFTAKFRLRAVRRVRFKIFRNPRPPTPPPPGLKERENNIGPSLRIDSESIIIVKPDNQRSTVKQTPFGCVRREIVTIFVIFFPSLLFCKYAVDNDPATIYLLEVMSFPVRAIAKTNDRSKLEYP